MNRTKFWTRWALFFLLSVALHAQTLGEATREVTDLSQTLIEQRLPDVDSWGEQTALDDLRGVHEASAALSVALEGSEADAVRTQQQALVTAARRLKTSQSLLPNPAQAVPTLDDLQTRILAIDDRLTQLRLRFAEKATQKAGPMADLSLAPNEEAFTSYENPQELLIDVRDARRLAASLESGRFPRQGIGFGQPNNLDSLQVRRLVLAGWDLQRALEGQYSDISQVQPKWDKFQTEYNRLGYPGSNTVTRQLDRVMTRLAAFFSEVSE